MDNKDFYSIKIGLASPEMIREWSYGEVTKPETINYRTLKPEVGGLFCERIFGPTKDGACMCGKYKNSHSKEVIKCEKCGVDVTTKKVRRERMGHIELACPVSHIWYFKAVPSRMALVLDMSPKALEQVLYFAENVVLDPGTTPLTKGMVLNEKTLRENLELYGEDSFRYGMGAESIKELLQQIDVEETCNELKEELKTATGQRKTRVIKRLEVMEAFRKSGNHLDWMILDVVPVTPPDIRPMTQLDGGRFASSDLNELYRRVIARNNRLKELMAGGRAPEIMIKNEKRMLQEAIDSLIDNGKRGKPVTGASNRPLKSLSEMLRGKQGRFRQNLLGKRVDFSGRSVIVVGPNLKIYQCGLPKEMAIELFKPFVIKRLVELNKATNIKDAQKKIDRAYDPANACVWDALENVIKEHPVLLNRAPTLHRLSIQAFEPILVDGRAIKLHPLVCTAFNADFDGDQMPVHVPLSAEAQAEARFLMLSINNLLKPMDGKAVTVPTQDMILGAYYLTMEREGEVGEGGVYRDFDEAMLAYQSGCLGLHAKIKVRVTKEINGEKKSAIIGTTLGRLIYNEQIPQNLGFVDRSVKGNEFKLEIDFVVKKKQLGQIIDRCIRYNDSATCADMLDAIKAMGYKYSTKASFSISVYDMTIPKEKKTIIENAQKQVDVLNNYYRMGLFSNEERYASVVELWGKTTKDVVAKVQEAFSPYNSINIMIDSGARGSVDQLRQLSGMRGLMFATNGRTIEIPIKSNFRESLNVLEYFMGAKGSRKSLSDTALRTADSGYLTRRLVDVSQDVIVREVKCDTKEGELVTAVNSVDGKALLEPLADRIVGRFTMGPVIDPATGETIVDDDVMLTTDMVEKIEKAGITAVKIRNVIHCHARYGICSHCYGADLANGKLVNVGEAVGIIAAQSIGEPGTQLTMRTFHSGGIAGSNITQGLPRVEELFEARQPKKPAIITEVAGTATITTGENMIHTVTVTPDPVQPREDIVPEVKEYTIPYGTKLIIKNDQHLELGEAITEGSKSPADILRILGLNEVYSYLIREVQMVYRAQECNVNDKHIEIIARQMTRKRLITDAGDTDLLTGSKVDIYELERANNAIDERIANGETELRHATGDVILLGITKAALQTESFMSAASFQETTKVLTEAAIEGKTDYLRGLKENVIIGKLIPAGTGMECYKGVGVRNVAPDPEPDPEGKKAKADKADDAENAENAENADATETAENVDNNTENNENTEQKAG